DLLNVFAGIAGHDFLEDEVRLGGGELDLHGGVAQRRQALGNLDTLVAEGVGGPHADQTRKAGQPGHGREGRESLDLYTKTTEQGRDATHGISPTSRDRHLLPRRVVVPHRLSPA